MPPDTRVICIGNMTEYDCIVVEISMIETD